MSRLIFVFVLSLAVLAARMQKSATDKTARADLKRTCSVCHSLDVIRAQRLSRAEWDRELSKMTLMGARIADRKSLLDYLEKKYGEPPAR